GTGDLNRVIREALTQQPPPLRQNRRPKVFYATQADVHPPTVVLFTNGPDLFDNTYRRYLVKYLRDQTPFTDVPIKLLLRSKHREDQRDLEGQAEEAPGGRKRRAAEEVSGSVAGEKADRDAGEGEPELWDL